MDAEFRESRTLTRRLLRREAARWWWAPLVAGLIWFLIAWLVLRADLTSLATVGVLVGVVLLVAAVSEAAIGGIVIGGWKVVHYALVVLFVLGAVWSFVQPIATFFALASMLGLLLFLQGALYIARSLALREEGTFWWLGLISGVLIVLLALWVSVSDRVWNLAGRAVFILFWVGLMAAFRGFSDIVLAFELRRFGNEGEGAKAEPGDTDQSRPIPTQHTPAHAEGDRQPEAQPGTRR